MAAANLRGRPLTRPVKGRVEEVFDKMNGNEKTWCRLLNRLEVLDETMFNASDVVKTCFSPDT